MRANEFAGNWLSERYYSNPTLQSQKNPEFWGVYYFGQAGGPGRTCLAASNRAVIEKALQKYTSGKYPTVIEICDRHFCCGCMDGLAIKVFCSNGKTPTKAYAVFAKLMAELEEYPILDEDDWSKREWELFEGLLHETVENTLYFVADKEVTEGQVEDLCHRFKTEMLPLGKIDTSEGSFPYQEVESFVRTCVGSPKEDDTKLDYASYNGTYKSKKHGDDTVCVQWYPGVGSFYVACYVNGKMAHQGSFDLGGLNKLIKKEGFVIQ